MVRSDQYHVRRALSRFFSKKIWLTARIGAKKCSIQGIFLPSTARVGPTSDRQTPTRPQSGNSRVSVSPRRTKARGGGSPRRPPSGKLTDLTSGGGLGQRPATALLKGWRRSQHGQTAAIQVGPNEFRPEILRVLRIRRRVQSSQAARPASEGRTGPRNGADACKSRRATSGFPSSSSPWISEAAGDCMAAQQQTARGGRWP